MHEYSIVRALIDKVDGEARRHGAASVHRVRVAIGELSGVEVDLFATAFGLARERTICAQAELEVIRVPVRWVCRECGGEIDRDGRLECAACGGRARLESGDEIVLERLEMEVASNV